MFCVDVKAIKTKREDEKEEKAFESNKGKEVESGLSWVLDTATGDGWDGGGRKMLKASTSSKSWTEKVNSKQ